MGTRAQADGVPGREAASGASAGPDEGADGPVRAGRGRPDPEAGMATAEYAIATLAAAAFAGVLLVVVRSGEVRDAITAIIRQALSI